MMKNSFENVFYRLLLDSFSFKPFEALSLLIKLSYSPSLSLSNTKMKALFIGRPLLL